MRPQDACDTPSSATATGLTRNSQRGGFSIFVNAPCFWPESMSGQPGAPVRVLVVDSDSHARSVVAQELMGDTRTVVVGQAGSIREGKRLVRDSAFDVLLLDIRLDDGPAFELVTLARAQRSAEVVAMSKSESDDDAMRAFELGAAGFLVKSSWFVSFVQAVLQVANGGASVSPGLSRRMLVRNPVAAPAEDAGDRRKVVQVRLSMREQEVLRMIASGLTSSEIGLRLAISCTTVNSHVKNMYQKLQVHSRAQAVRCASTWGLI
jgi:DNA-binding NarL/FixJ family response regulator